MQTIWQDIRHGLRIMAKNPDLAAIAILLTIAFGFGLHVAISSLMATAHRRSLPVRAAGQIVVIAARDSDAPASLSISYPMYLDLRERNGVLTGASSRCRVAMDLRCPAAGERVRGELVSGNYFEVLGVNPWIGRLISEEDDHASITSPVAVISYELWNDHFGMNPAIVNRTIFLNGFRFTVIGVTPPGFVGTDRFNRADIQVPLSIMKVFSPPVLRATRIDPMAALRYE